MKGNTENEKKGIITLNLKVYKTDAMCLNTYTHIYIKWWAGIQVGLHFPFFPQIQILQSHVHLCSRLLLEVFLPILPSIANPQEDLEK